MYLKIAVVYRPPNALEIYFIALIDNLNKAVCDKNEFIMLGDMNLTHDDLKVKILCNLLYVTNYTKTNKESHLTLLKGKGQPQ